MKNQAIVIQSPEQLYQEALNVYFNDAPIREYEISNNLNIQLILKGPQWDGRVDYRIAKFVLKLQDEIFWAYTTATEEKVDLRSSQEIIDSLVVSVEIKDGSSFLNVDWNKAIQGMIARMDSKHVFWLGAIGVVAVSSYLSLGIFLDYKTDIAKLARDRQQAAVLENMTKEALYSLRSSQSSMNYLIRSMGDNDKLEIPAQGKVLTKQEARSLLPTAVDKTPIEKSLWVDDVFDVTVLNLEKQTIKLQKGDIQFYANSIAMRDKDKEKLSNIVRKSMDENKVQRTNLQLTIGFKDGEIDTCSITGVGKKRPAANTLGQAFKKVQ